MQAEFDRLIWTLVLGLVAGAALFVLRIVLAGYLRKRLPAGLVPKGEELHRPDAMSRFISLLGHAAQEAETLGTKRLRATLGLKLLYWVVLIAMALTLAAMQHPRFGMAVQPLGFEPVLLGVVLYLALHTSFYEISYDREEVTFPRWWFGRTTHKWGQLDAVTEKQGWFLSFHFRDGTVVQAHKYVVGYAALRDKAEAVLREV